MWATLFEFEVKFGLKALIFVGQAQGNPWMNLNFGLEKTIK